MTAAPRKPVPEVPLADRIVLNMEEAGALLGASREFVRNEINLGRIRPLALGENQYTKIHRAELERWATSLTGGGS